MRYIIEVNLSNVCNLHCKYCISSSSQVKKDKGGYLLNGTVINYRRAFNWIKSNFSRDDVLSVLITGGEPTILPEWHWLPDALKDEGYAVLILSNGIGLKKTDYAKHSHKFLLSWHCEQMAWETYKESCLAAKDKHSIAGLLVLTPEMIFDEWEINLLEEKFRSIPVPYFIRGAQKATYFNDYGPMTTGFNDMLYQNKKDKYGSPINLSPPVPHLKDVHILSIRSNGDYALCYHSLYEPMGNIYDDGKFNCDTKCRECKDSSGNSLCSAQTTAQALMNLFPS